MIKDDFSKIVSLHKDKVFNTCLGFVKDFDDAEDIAQEVFIEVYKKQDQFKGESKLGTWIYRIAVNKSLEHLRKRKIIPEIPGQGLKETVSSHFHHPGVDLENKERSAILFKAIDSLTESQRVAFVLQKLEGLSIGEIAAIMQRTESSVESLLKRAKENLREKLRSYYEE